MNSFRLLLTASLVLFAVNLPALNAQELSEKWVETIDLSFNDNFNYFLDEDVKWKILNQEGLMMKSGNGPISNLQIDQPGAYRIEIQESKNHDHSSCNHAHFPTSIELNISAYSIDFDFEGAVFSRELTGGSVDGLEITIPISFQTLTTAELSLKDFKIIGSGIGANFTGQLKNNGIALQQGKNNLTFVLSGSVQAGTYIMFDFVGLPLPTQTYYYPKQLN